MPLLATLVDTASLLKVIAAAFVVGPGLTLAFSLSVFGSIRFADMQREGRAVSAVFFGALAAVGAAVCAAAVVLGIVVMTSK